MRVHTVGKPFECTVCMKGFNVSGSLTTHMRVHTVEKPFKCTIFMKGCSESGSLTTHMRVHMGEKPFKCRYELYERIQSKWKLDNTHESTHYTLVKNHSSVQGFSISGSLTKYRRVHRRKT